MGFSPTQIDDMSLWQFMACVDGVNKSRGDNKPEPPTDDEFEAISSRMIH